MDQQISGAGEMVVFAVTLPQASQNSLVVTQPNSDAVKSQVAGWFTTQMASRGAPPAAAAPLTCLMVQVDRLHVWADPALQLWSQLEPLPK